MIEDVQDVGLETLTRFDSIIDVRTPAEFEIDRLPGAVNLPVLSNEQRAIVGAIYKQESRFKARRIGAAMIARNVAQHLDGPLAHFPAKWRPLLYCWRGGMRSGAMATILERVGWRVGVLNGGYKAWRREVVAGLRASSAPINVVLLDGQTGTAKTEILQKAAAIGVQVIDLETLAAHRGSAFGAFATVPQPSQKLFESQLWGALRKLDLSRPILIEAESNHVGRLEIPSRLWKAMQAAQRIVLRADAVKRADYLVGAYADILGDEEAIATALDLIAHLHEKERIADWRRLAELRDWRALALGLMLEHYDPSYERIRRRRCDEAVAELTLNDFNAPSIDWAARQIQKILERKPPVGPQ